MSVIDEIKDRLTKLEDGEAAALAARIEAIEQVLGLSPAALPGHPLSTAKAGAVNLDCRRCGNLIAPDNVNRCKQEKCPLK